jgi:hypothetical protein
LSDDNRQFFSETELRLADMSLLISPEDGHIEVDEFQIYSAASYLPWNMFTGGISGSFRFGIEPHYDDQLERKLAGNVGGSLGLTLEPIRYLSVFGTINMGLDLRAGELHAYVGPELGLIADEARDMKTILMVARLYGQLDSDDHYTRVRLVQSMRLSSRYTAIVNGTYFLGDGESRLELGVNVEYLF